MADTHTDKDIHRGLLSSVRLYTGDQDAEMDIYDLAIGTVAASTIGDTQKPGPNEDSAAIIPVDDSHVVLVVADGVGGLNAARQASNLTVQAIRKALDQVAQSPGRGLRTAILDGIESANQAVLKAGGASTLALAEIGPDYVRTYHVGDSIVLQCGQRGALKSTTTPHSPVGFALEAGLLNEKEALNHEHLNLIFNVIGSIDMRIEIGSMQKLAPRDTLLVASDGLADNLMQEEIISTIRKGSLDQAIGAVTRLARGRMDREHPGKPSKPDDFTALLFRRRAPGKR